MDVRIYTRRTLSETLYTITRTKFGCLGLISGGDIRVYDTYEHFQVLELKIESLMNVQINIQITGPFSYFFYLGKSISKQVFEVWSKTSFFCEIHVEIFSLNDALSDQDFQFSCKMIDDYHCANRVSGC